MAERDPDRPGDKGPQLGPARDARQDNVDSSRERSPSTARSLLGARSISSPQDTAQAAEASPGDTDGSGGQIEARAGDQRDKGLPAVSSQISIVDMDEVDLKGKNDHAGCLATSPKGFPSTNLPIIINQKQTQAAHRHPKNQNNFTPRNIVHQPKPHLWSQLHIHHL